MNQALQAVPFVRSIFHPSDFSQASQLAFVHALAIALLRKTSLVIMHASRVPVVEDWARFPRVRKTLEQWQLLAPGSPRAAVAEQLAIHVTSSMRGATRCRQASIISRLRGRTWW